MNAPKQISLLKGTSIVSSLTIVSRIFGFIRDLLVAKLFGAGFFADAFFVAFRIPNLLRSLAAEGALTSAFVPIFSSELEKGKDFAQQALKATGSLIVKFVSALCVLSIIFSPEIVSMIAPGFTKNQAQFELTVLLTRIMLPYLLFISLISMINGALNSVGIFGAASLSQIIVNLTLIIGALLAGFYQDYSAAIILAISVPLGGFASIILQIPFLKKASLYILPTGKAVTKVTKEILKLMLPAVFGAAVYQVGIFLNTALASVLSPGSVSWLFYSDRIVQFPIGVFTVALASVLLPSLSRSEAKKSNQEFITSIQDSIRFTSFIIIPTAFGLYYLAEPVARIVFERGEFSALDSKMTAISIKAFCFGLWSVSCHSMLVRAFLAKKDTRTPMFIGLASLVIGFIVSVFFMGQAYRNQGWIGSLVDLIQSSAPNFVQSFGHVGLALGSIFYSFVSLILSVYILLQRLEGFSLKSLIISSLKSTIASVGMCLAISKFFSVSSLSFIGLVLAILFGILIYIIISLILQSSELKETFRRFSRLLK